MISGWVSLTGPLSQCVHKAAGLGESWQHCHEEKKTEVFPLSPCPCCNRVPGTKPSTRDLVSISRERSLERLLALEVKFLTSSREEDMQV